MIVQICYCVSSFLLIPALCVSQQEANQIEFDEVSQFLMAVEDYYESSELSKLERSARENVIVVRGRSGLTAAEDAAAQLHALGREYWQRRDHDKAIEIFEASVDMSPQSFAAAKSWIMIGNIWYGNKRSPERSIEFFEASEEVLKKIEQKSSLDDLSLSQLKKSQAVICSRLGFANSVVNNSARSLSYYNRLIDDATLSAEASSSMMFNAIQASVKHSQQNGDIKRLATLRDAVESGSIQLAPDKKLYLLLNVIRGQWAFGVPERVTALEKIWKNSAIPVCTELLSIGDELCLTYLLDIGNADKHFSTCVIELQNRYFQFHKVPRSSEQKAEDNLFIRIGLVSSVALKDRTRMNATSVKFQKEFDEVSKQCPILVSVPGHIEARPAQKIADKLIDIRDRLYPHDKKKPKAQLSLP